MSGRQLLDIAAIFKASRGVVSKHVALRRRQLDVYRKTSSLMKSINKQTGKPTTASSSGLALSTEGVNDTGSSTPAKQNDRSRLSTNVSTQDHVNTLQKSVETKSGVETDTSYKRSGQSNIAPARHKSGLKVQQREAARYPLPGGSIPSVGSPVGLSKGDHDMLSSVSPKEPEKKPLASQLDGNQNTVQPISSVHQNIQTPEEKRPTTKKVEGREDSTKQSSTSFVSRSLAALKIESFSSNGAEYEQSTSIAQSVPEVQAIPEQGQPSDEMYSEIFHSPRVARLLKVRPEHDTSPKSLDLQGVQSTPVEQSEISNQRDQVSFNIRPILEPKLETEEGASAIKNTDRLDRSKSEDTHQVVETLANNSPSASSFASQIPPELEKKSGNPPFKMHESRVPSSRLGRLWEYGGLATSMAFGAVGESFRRATAGGEGTSGSLMLSAGNMERLVAKLSKMRGAALKVGQILSFQDSKTLPAPINEVLQRVQDSADYMPAGQRNQVLASNLGSDWQSLFTSFDEMPMAAASIGQVHGAVLKSSGQRVAIKVQYPGVANSIDSDLNNLTLLLTASRLLPKGLYLDKTIANARTELAWECDYIREAECGKRFQNLLSDDQDVFVVPSIIDEASGPQVLTMERMEGIGVTKAQNLTQDQKDWVGTQILRLCLREITEFRFMQTDPNWTNFLFNARTQKLELLDFGASRDFPDHFIQPYIRILHAASRHDRDSCRDLSVQLGYLTGHESPAMLKAHVDSILTLAEPFWERSPEVYDFRDQTITDRVRGLIPVMLRERLAPPPEETYSLHRKLSGAFLLCARLGSRVRCREMFANAMERAGVS